MVAVVVSQAGGPEVLTLTDIPKPQPRTGWILIQIKAFGLNRSEMFTRKGDSGDAVSFPRVLGIECVGIVEDNGGTDIPVGSKVAAMMGEMGRTYDGGYAEFTLVPRDFVHPVDTQLPWEQFAALPETFVTAWGSLHEALQVKAGDTLLIRGGTSSIGMAATTIAKHAGLQVIATTRNEIKKQALLDNGVDEVIIDTGEIAPTLRKNHPEGVDHVLELVGTVVLFDSLNCLKRQGTLCFTGILGNAWTLPNFSPFDLPSTVKLTTYASEEVKAGMYTEALQEAVRLAEQGVYRINLDRVFSLREIVQSHEYMESNKAKGKLVVLVNHV